ncbi:MAG: ribosome biogenesis GTPase YlqF [Gammaproteobacteria bacterium]|jgi:ribosome biogenesis GTPase A|nr:ribosome biogenesis GTPase YlqF [Gammaproteobacteria bacterium]
MTIGWYPGHMNKARKDIIKLLQQVDLVIELVDARLPYSSENPLLNSLIGDIARLKILNKTDLADPSTTNLWLEFYKQKSISCFALDKTQPENIKKLLKKAKSISGKKSGKILRIMILGIPNVGKSTFLNILTDRKIAKVGNEPAVTKASNEISLDDSIKLIDTPGVLWPKIEDQNSAYRLAVTGAIKNTAIEFEDIALFALDFLRDEYPERLKSRYQLSEVNLDAAVLLEAIGKQRGCLRKGGVDFNKASEALLHDIRNSALGKISLEKPESIPQI